MWRRFAFQLKSPAPPTARWIYWPPILILFTLAPSIVCKVSLLCHCQPSTVKGACDPLGPKDCIKLAVPISLDEYRARLRLRIKFDGVTDYKIDSVKEVVLVKTDDIDLIQTDKAWYTPGQLVRFRVLSLDRMLYPIMDPVSA